MKLKFKSNKTKNEEVINQTIHNNNQNNDEIKISKFQKTIKILFQTRWFILFIAIILILKTMLLYKAAIYSTKQIDINDIFIATSFIALLLTLPMFLKGKIRFWVTMIINILISILLFANELYYTYSSNLVSVAQFSNLRYGREISSALPNLVHIRQILYIIDIIIIITIYFINRKLWNKSEKTKSRFNVKEYLPGIIYSIIILCITIFGIKNWIQEASEYRYNKLIQIEKTGIYGYHYLDIVSNINMKNTKYKTKKEAYKAYDELMSKYKDNYSLEYNFEGIAKDKNVIVVQLESVQNFVVNRTINGNEITPNLNKFLKENIQFTNMQNQSYSTTADSEFTEMNSLYPLENGMLFAQYSSNDYNDIYQNYKNAGYSTTYIHGNEGGFWNRKAVYSRLKIDNLFFDDIFDKDVERINNYVSDEQVYKKMVEMMKTYKDKFFVNIIAASSHTAFDMPGIQDRENKVSIDVGGEYRHLYFGDYLEAVNYADYAFGVFINDLKEAELYDDTVILVYGDHAGLQMYNYEMQDFIKEVRPLNDIQTQINYSNVLCGLKIPGISSTKIDKPESKLDIKPTLMEICGIEDKFSLGQSMFSNKDFVCINTGRIITDKYFYDGDWYIIETGEMVNVENLPSSEKEKLNYYLECMQTELDISMSINVHNWGLHN